ncbi:MAG: hypothetical protein NW226_19680 [Microscillaceae bacterium]|nr:hypothetical protein [Microscillaceae bacterium]
MISSLRKRHRIHWVALGILLSVGFVAALRVHPPKPVQESILSELPEAYPTILKEVENENLKINLREDKQNRHQLELLLKKPVKLPAPLLYLNITGELNPQGNTLLAPLGAVGLYRFQIFDENIQGIFFYSPLNGKTAYPTKLK